MTNRSLNPRKDDGPLLIQHLWITRIAEYRHSGNRYLHILGKPLEPNCSTSWLWRVHKDRTTGFRGIYVVYCKVKSWAVSKVGSLSCPRACVWWTQRTKSKTLWAVARPAFPLLHVRITSDACWWSQSRSALYPRGYMLFDQTNNSTFSCHKTIFRPKTRMSFPATSFLRPCSKSCL